MHGSNDTVGVSLQDEYLIPSKTCHYYIIPHPCNPLILFQNVSIIVAHVFQCM